MSEGRTRDKGMRVGGRWIHHYKDEQAASASAQQKKEEEPTGSRTTKGEEESKPQEYWADVRADSPVSGDTYKCIDVLKTEYPVCWLNLMRHEPGFLTNEEALEEIREEARGNKRKGARQRSRKKENPGA